MQSSDGHSSTFWALADSVSLSKSGHLPGLLTLWFEISNFHVVKAKAALQCIWSLIDLTFGRSRVKPVDPWGLDFLLLGRAAGKWTATEGSGAYTWQGLAGIFPTADIPECQPCPCIYGGLVGFAESVTSSAAQHSSSPLSVVSVTRGQLQSQSTWSSFDLSSNQ